MASEIDAYFASRLEHDPRRAILWSTLWDAYFSRLIDDSDTVLDLGAGHCSFINAVRARVRIATDHWQGTTEYASPGVRVHIGDITDLQWLEDQTVDFAFASNVFEHLTRDQLQSVLSQLLLKLRPKGKLCLVQPNYRYCSKEYFDDYTHVSVFSHISLSDFLSANGFRVVRSEPRFLPLTIKSRLPIHRALIKAYLALPLKPLAKQMLILAEPNR